MKKKIIELRNDRFGFKTAALILCGLIILFAGLLAGNFLANYLLNSGLIDAGAGFNTVAGILETLFCVAFLYGFVRFVLGEKMSFFRITGFRLSAFGVTAAILLPAAVVGFYLLLIDGELLVDTGMRYSDMLSWALRAGLRAGITEELIFRAFIMKLIEQRWNRAAAVFVPSVVFALLHTVQGMGAPDLIMLFIAGVAVGLMFSLITYSADSIWDAVLVHAVWNALILGIVHISTAGGLRLLVNYRIDSGNILITGGRFGIEAGLPASAAFIIVCIAAVFKIKRKSRAGAG